VTTEEPRGIVARCCHIHCEKIAEWIIVHGSSPDDYTESCTEHVGILLTDAIEHRIYQISVEAALAQQQSRARGREENELRDTSSLV